MEKEGCVTLATGLCKIGRMSVVTRQQQPDRQYRPAMNMSLVQIPRCQLCICFVAPKLRDWIPAEPVPLVGWLRSQHVSAKLAKQSKEYTTLDGGWIGWMHSLCRHTHTSTLHVPSATTSQSAVSPPPPPTHPRPPGLLPHTIWQYSAISLLLSRPHRNSIIVRSSFPFSASI